MIVAGMRERQRRRDDQRDQDDGGPEEPCKVLSYDHCGSHITSRRF